MLFTRKTALLERDAILPEKLVNLILVLRLNHHGGIGQLFDDGFLERLILKILFDEELLERLILKRVTIEKIGLR